MFLFSSPILYDSLKLLKWWAQSTLVDAQHIFCGIKEKDSTTVHRVKTYKVKELPGLCNASEYTYKQENLSFYGTAVRVEVVPFIEIPLYRI